MLMVGKGNRVELHNLGEDRAEDIDKDQSREHPDIVGRLSKLVLDWRPRCPRSRIPRA